MAEYPTEMTPELRYVLGLPNFRCGPIAHLFVAAGRAKIPAKSEEEQAFVLHWLIGLVLKHGAAYADEADRVLDEMKAEARARRDALQPQA